MICYMMLCFVFVFWLYYILFKNRGRGSSMAKRLGDSILGTSLRLWSFIYAA